MGPVLVPDEERGPGTFMGQCPARVDLPTVTDLARLRGCHRSSPLDGGESQAKTAHDGRERHTGSAMGHAEDDPANSSTEVPFLCDDDRAGTAGADLGDVTRPAVQLGAARGRR